VESKMRPVIRPITGEEILQGLGQDYYCYMFGSNKREYKCSMWPTIFDEVGGIGYLAREDDRIVGQLIFLPKKYARRVALPTCPENGNLGGTMVISCLYVIREFGGRGIASQMIDEALKFCRKHGFTRIEAVVDCRPPEESGINTSYYPFRKFGFILDGSREAWEFRPESRMCYLEFKRTGGQTDRGESRKHTSSVT
jgi:GNAT superfamily N-acetyltransferase